MSQSNEGDSPVKGGKEPCQTSPENHYLCTVARWEKSCAHSLNARPGLFTVFLDVFCRVTSNVRPGLLLCSLMYFVGLLVNVRAGLL